MKAKKSTDVSAQHVKCYTCGSALEIPKLNPNVRKKNKRLSIGLNAYLLPRPEILNGVMSLDLFEVFCLNCYHQGVFFKRFNQINKDLYEHSKLQVLEQLKAQYRQDFQRLNNFNFFLQMKEKQTERRSRVLAEEIQKHQEEHQIFLNSIESLSSWVKSVARLQDRLNSFVLAADKYNSVRQISEILSFIDEKSQRSNSQTNEFLELHQDISSFLEDYTEYELDLTVRSEDNQESEEEFYFHEDQLNFHNRTYNIDHSFLTGLKNQLKNVEKLIQDEFAALKSKAKASQEKWQKAIEAPVVNQHAEDFAVMLECSGCRRALFINKLCYQRVAPSHFKIGINFYIFNSPHDSESLNPSETFESFCKDCFHRSAYSNKFKKLWNQNSPKQDEFVQTVDTNHQSYEITQSNLTSLTLQQQNSANLTVEKQAKQLKNQKLPKIVANESKKKKQKNKKSRQDKQKQLEQQRKEKERKIAQRFIKRLQLQQRLGAMWFLEESEVEGLRQQALHDEEFMDHIISEGNLMFNYPDQSLMWGMNCSEDEEEPQGSLYNQDSYTKYFMQHDSQLLEQDQEFK